MDYNMNTEEDSNENLVQILTERLNNLHDKYEKLRSK